MPKGRKAQPTKLKLLKGNPGKRPVGNEPQPAGGVPDCPDHLGPEAREEWDRLVASLGGIPGLLTPADRGLMAAYCDAYGRWVVATREVENSSPVVKAPKSGHPMQNPWRSEANKALDQMAKFGSEFGLSPAARARIHLPGDAGVDALDTFLCKTRG